MFDLILGIVIAVAIYKTAEMAMIRFERLKAMQKLEGHDLVDYLGKAAPQEDYLKQTMWWLMRIGSVLIGIGVAMIQVIWLGKQQLTKGSYSDTAQVMLTGGMILCGAFFLIIELFIERKLRK